jgi:fructose-bisphosphate aldolase, class I
MTTPRITQAVAEILENYEGEPPGVKANLYRILMSGRLAGTGKVVILPVDQGFEHGPARSFAVNPMAYDPLYHYKLAIEAGCSAYAAPVGSLAAGADTFAGQIPTILKVNSANALDSRRRDTNQAVTASAADALRLGCAAVGFTIYPGSDNQYEMFEEVRDMIAQARAVGIPSVVWSYPRGGTLSEAGETAMDVIGAAAHMACLLGAHIVKVKLPSAHLEQTAAAKVFKDTAIPLDTQADRVREVMRSAFAGRRIVVFSGGAAKGAQAVFDDARAIREGGGNGSIIGRNSFQRPFDEAVEMLGRIMEIYERG